MTSTPARTSHARPQFIEVEGRRLFVVDIVPAGPVRGSILYLPPFGEEMNRCRSHVAATARALAASGWRCLLLDPFATGESEGSTAEGDWDLWARDALGATAWLRDTGAGPVTLWAARTGALTAAEVAVLPQAGVEQLLLWQPVLDGSMFLNQHLRLRLASQLVHAGEKETTELLRQRLAAGEAIEVAGYAFTGRLADGLTRRNLDALASATGLKVAWMELVSKPDQPLGAASRKLIDRRLAAGAPTVVATPVCPPIWQLHERADAPALADTTVRLLEGETT